MGFDYDAYLQDRYEDSCEELELERDADGEEDDDDDRTEDVLDNMNRRMEAFAIASGDL